MTGSPDQLAQQLWDLPPGEAEAILRRHALTGLLPEETIKRVRQQQADMVYAALKA